MNEAKQQDTGFGFRGPATLPLFRPRSRVFSSRRSQARAIFNNTELQVAPQNEMHRFARLVGAVACVLSRYSGEANVTVGVPDSQPDMFRVLDIPVEDDQTGVDLHKICLGKLQSPDLCPVVSRQTLLGAAQPEMPFGNPRFAVAICHARDIERLDGVWNDAFVYESETATTLVIDYSARLFPCGIVESFAHHVARAFVDLTLHVTQPACAIELLDAVERAAVLDIARGAVVPSRLRTVIEIFDETVRKHPHVGAAELNGQVLTYGELDRQAAMFARYLKRSVPVHNGSLGICCGPSFAQLWVLLGVLRAGYTAVPLDLTLPKSRLEMMVADAGIHFVVSEPSFIDYLPQKLITIEPPEKLHDDSQAPQAAAQEPDVNLWAYVMFTSGSTGRPKAVPMTHAAFANLIEWQVERSAPGLRTAGRTSIAFDVGFQEIFATLCSAGTLVIMNEDLRRDIASQADFLTLQRINRVFLPPVALYQLAERLAGINCDLGDLREVIVAGDVLQINPRVVELFRRSEAILENQYGPTETHVASAYRLPPSPLSWPARPPIGKPVRNLEVVILDRGRRLLPIGARGEIYIGGVCVSPGYMGARAPIFPHWTSSDGMRFYATGDLGWYDHAGLLHFEGRNDQQVKIRGYRVELGDIEAYAVQHEAVVSAAAHTFEGADAGRYVALYVVPVSGFAPTPAELRAFLQHSLPEYMLPPLWAITFADELPLTATGKVDRAKLPAPNHTHIAAVTQPVRRDTPSLVANIVARRIRIQHAGLDDDFFAIGGDSLSGIQIVSEINSRFEVYLPLSQLFRLRTPRAIAGAIDALLGGSQVVTAKSTLGPEQITLPDGTKLLCAHAEEARYLYEDVIARNNCMHPAFRLEADALTIIDVGAHIGLFTVHAARRYPSAKIYALEPAPESYSLLKKNVRPFENRVVCIEAAVTDTEGAAHLTYYPQVAGMSSLHADLQEDKKLLSQIIANVLRMTRGKPVGWEHLESLIPDRFEGRVMSCRTVTLGTILDLYRLSRIDMLKIDVQRSELEVLRGLQPSHWKRVERVCVEVHDNTGRLESVLSLLRANGFSIACRQSPLHEGTAVHFVYGSRREKL